MKWSKSKIAVGSTALVLIAVGAVFFFKWLRDPQRVAAETGEHLIAEKLAVPLDMTQRIQTPAVRFKNITQFPAWQSVPIGSQTFCNVPIQIDGMICLYGEGNAKMGLKFPEVWPDIPINQKFETLYVYHCTFMAVPTGTPVYDLVFRYEDGSSVTNEILYGKDVLDWYSFGAKVAGPTAARSKLAWKGEADLGAKKQALRFCLTAVENPFPNVMVTTVDLYSRKTESAACIQAFTPGRAGLMK
jgi:hypothetical protein